MDVEKKKDLLTMMCECTHVPVAWSTKHSVMGGDLVLADAYGILVEIDSKEVTSYILQGWQMKQSSLEERLGLISRWWLIF